MIVFWIACLLLFSPRPGARVIFRFVLWTKSRMSTAKMRSNRQGSTWWLAVPFPTIITLLMCCDSSMAQSLLPCTGGPAYHCDNRGYPSFPSTVWASNTTAMWIKHGLFCSVNFLDCLFLVGSFVHLDLSMYLLTLCLAHIFHLQIFEIQSNHINSNRWVCQSHGAAIYVSVMLRDA